MSDILNREASKVSQEKGRESLSLLYGSGAFIASGAENSLSRRFQFAESVTSAMLMLVRKYAVPFATWSTTLIGQ